jgi:hypothetical protein
MTCEATAKVLFVDDDTVRTWQQDRKTASKVWQTSAVRAAPDPAPHRREVGAWIARECAMNTRPGRG